MYAGDVFIYFFSRSNANDYLDPLGPLSPPQLMHLGDNLSRFHSVKEIV